MSRIKIPVAEIEIDPEGGTIWVHNDQGVTVMRLSIPTPMDKPVDTGKNFIDARLTYANHVQVQLGPGSVVET